MPRIGGILANSLSNGVGCRTVIFFAGCRHKCKGCQNKHLWPLNSGIKISFKNLYNIIDKNLDMIDGITFSGGEPFLHPKSLSKLTKYAKSKKLNIWCYTGYTIKELIQLSFKNKYIKYALKNIDVLIDGKYIEELQNDNLKWRGSSNQNIIYLSQILMKF